MANSYGGQALIEGVMMRGKHTQAMCARLEDGRIVSEVEEFTLLSQRNKFFALPLVRGVCSMIDSLVSGMQAIVWSTNVSLAEDEEEEELTPMEIAITLIISIGLGVLLFFLLPVVIAHFLQPLIPGNFWQNLFEGIVRVGVFLLYLVLITRMKEIRRVFQYHGAEHKAIHCFEHGLPMTPDNARQFPRLHVRCGTAFLIMVMVIAILVYTIFPLNAIISGFGVPAGLPKLVLVIVARIVLMPVIAGISYEITVKWAGSHPDNPLVKVILWPGMQMQYLTTHEPDDAQMECAIAAMQAVLAREDAEEAKAAAKPVPAAS